jgi:photosystem II stability/assembly factor-like uncharacterized protein
MANVVIQVGTKKGAFLLKGSTARDNWDLSGPFVGGIDVNHTVVDPRTATVYATANNTWFGPQVHYSKDFGATWTPSEVNPRFSGDPVVKGMDDVPWFFREGQVTERFWRIVPGRPEEPGALYCGVAPGALFESKDGGVTWAENTALSAHPTREGWQPSNGGLAMHSIVLDPDNLQRYWVAVSAGGVYRTEDGGASWNPTNAGIRDISATFDPNLPLYPESGQCVHMLAHAAGDNDRLYLQTHLGTYRTDNGGDQWIDITEGLPSEFGLTLAAHKSDSETAYVVPLQGGELRCPPDFGLKVYRTTDAGATWEPLTKGLPQDDAFMGVYRSALCTDDLDPGGVYVGTNTGQLYVSSDNGDSWSLITQNLPPITSVEATRLD